jgi:hypothetical protein
MVINNRETDRFSFASVAWVKLFKKNDKEKDFKMYELVDISQSGVSFRAIHPNEFKRGDEFYILEIGDKILKKALHTRVIYVVEVETDTATFIKVGSEFIEKL